MDLLAFLSFIFLAKILSLPPQMTDNEFIGFDYCVKHEPDKLATALCRLSRRHFSKHFQGLWSLVLVHGFLHLN